ncbi:protein FAM163A [Danio rerio]|uniref:Protein FAM163A n=1 Tax=Danio rerio TaxID=7955 RepID=B0S6B8_DANRE|nr:protein FAM163A [Danio rerio]|eukprot:XP_002660900.1 protein FAM163A [Danio rerio]
MTAGTVVITGGILATVILLCIIAVLCYCRLQYYCCKRNESEGEAGSVGDPQPQFACNAYSAPGVDGAAVTPLSLPYDPAQPHSYCPTCSPYYLRSSDEMRNGGERLSYMPTHYENHGATALGLAAMYGPVLSHRSTPDFYTNTRAISTDV